MLKTKGLASMVTAVAVAFSLAGTSFAAEDLKASESLYDSSIYLAEYSDSAYVNYLAEQSGKSLAELKRLEKDNGDLSAYLDIAVPDSIIAEDAKAALSQETYSLQKTINAEQIPGYYEAFSAYTGLSVEELKQAAEIHGDLSEYLGLPVETAKLQSAQFAQSRGGDFTIASDDGEVTPMTTAQWTTMKSKADKGDMLVSKDQSSYFINHGHTAIVYQTSAKTVEHTGSGTSSDYDISRWAKRYTMRDYYPSGTTSTKRQAAANYAYNSLTGKSYDAIADINSSTYVNCATLVWKAYKSESITLDYVPFYMGSPSGIPIKISDTVYPKTLVNDTDMTLWAGVNWSGGNNSW